MPQEKDLNYNPRKNDISTGEKILTLVIMVILIFPLSKYFLVWLKNVGEGKETVVWRN